MIGRVSLILSGAIFVMVLVQPGGGSWQWYTLGAVLGLASLVCGWAATQERRP